jgi:hypothetical protein
MFNFWVAKTTTNQIDPCPFLMEPGDWDTHYAFADAGALLHRENIRDCAMPWIGLYTTEIERDDTGVIDLWNARTLLHEGAHKVFGLADEYFTSFTVYYQGDPFPNVYQAGLGNNTCELEAPSVGNTTCHSWVGLGLGGLEWKTLTLSTTANSA